MGTWRPGKAADLTCLSENILETPEALADTRSSGRWPGAVVTHERA